MADDELAAIRAARLAQLKAQGGGGLSAPAPSNPKEGNGASEEMKRNLLYQLLSPEARERCIFSILKNSSKNKNCKGTKG